VDLGNVPKATPIFPIGPGTVIGAGDFGKGGNGVQIDHGNNIVSYYAHMNGINVKQGDRVELNNIIGTVGATGNARGSVHLHFEVKVNGQKVNPKDIIGKPIPA
jgi:murein DD-endopeptidase MepM/ murein hydrolase activator NlpD